MSTIPAVSVIVPNYNHARFLRERLDSILNQTFQDFELILLDDCSTDDSAAILREYSSYPKVSHLIINDTNSGSPFAQWKKGVERARGKYIWLAESDDVADNTFLASLEVGMDANTTICFTASNTIDKNGSVTGVYGLPGISQSITLSGIDFVERYMQGGSGIPNASAVVFLNSAVKRIRLPINMRFCGDWVTWVRLAASGNVFYQPMPLNYFRFHDKTTRPKSLKRTKSVVSFIETIDRPEYMTEFLDGAIEAYKILGRRWSPESLVPILKQIERIKLSLGPNQKFTPGIPLGMKILLAIRNVRSKLRVGPRIRQSLRMR